MPDYTVGDTVYKRFTTRAFATGIPTTLAGTPVVSAYEDDSVTQITLGITLGVDHDGVTGLNLLTIVATGGNGFGAGQSYDLVITTGTVGGVSVVGEVVWHFTLSAEAAAVDLANGTDGLGAIKTDTAAILVDTADMQPKIGSPAGASVSADIAAIEAQTDDIGVAGAGLTAIPTIANVTTVATLTGHTAQTGDNFVRLGAPAGASVSADIAVIEAQTDDIGVAGAGLTAIPIHDSNVTQWNGAAVATPTVAGVPEVDITHQGGGAIPAPAVAGVPDVNLTHHVDVAASVTNSELDVNVGQIIGTVPSLTGGDLDVNVAAMAAAVLTAAAIATDALTAAKLATDAVNEIRDAILSDSTAFAGANLNATISSRATPAQVNTEVSDVLKTDTVTLPGQVAPPLAPTMEQILSHIYKAYRNRKQQTSTQWSLMADNETTVDQKATVSDDATTAIKQEIVAGP